MQEHPVPQNVTGYEFHLIGQMTLKQFMEIAAGVILAVVINMTNLPVFIKYPLMAIAGLTGVALAFVPLEGRPLDRWFLAFVRSIYQPTMFFWKKTQTVPDVFEYKVPANLDTTPKVDYKPLRDSRVKEFLTTLPSASVSTQPDDDDLRAQAILALFESPSVKPTPQLIPPTPIQEAMKIPLPTKTESSSPISARILESENAPVVSPQPSVTKSHEESAGTTDVQVPTIEPVGYQTHAEIPLPQAPVSATNPGLSGEFTVVKPTTPNSFTNQGIKPVQTLSSLPFPSKPTVPNMVVGMVVSAEGKILENAIVTISKATDHTPVRALKTNALGQFAVVTPLEKGDYIISVEKDGSHFDNQSLVLNNQVVEPILIQAS